MAKTILQGPLAYKMHSLATAWRVTAGVTARRAIRKPVVPQWSTMLEYGTLLIRHRLEHAFSLPDIRASRAYMDSYYTAPDLDDIAEIHPNKQPGGHWLMPRSGKNDITMLYFHGGGYAFYLAVSLPLIASFAQTLGIPTFVPDYRLAPEHPHPAQIEDGVAAYEYLLAQGHDPRWIILCGDSAGGHLVLMAMAHFHAKQLPQPALAIGLSPWTNIGEREENMKKNEKYDLLWASQMSQFAAWFKGGRDAGDEELSPIHQNYQELAPIYLQAGENEIMIDMIRNFSKTLEKQGARVRLDVWKHMNHVFQNYGSAMPESREAIAYIQASIAWALQSDGSKNFSTIARTEVNTL